LFSSAFSDCSASDDESKCIEAFDNERENGWLHMANSPAWAIFELSEPLTLESLIILNGLQYSNKKLISFKIAFQVDGKWIDSDGLMIKNDPKAQIDTDGTITLTSGRNVLVLNFNPVADVQSVKLDVIETESENKFSLNEIIPIFSRGLCINLSNA
jgi:hypothetical protein